MIITLHLCGPHGEGQRQELDRALELLQLDNEFLIQAMLSAGRQVPDHMEDLGLAYRPPSPGDHQHFYGLRGMLENGWFRCGEAAGWEAAVQHAKYKVGARAFVNPLGNGFWHAVYQTHQGVVDPVARFLQSGGTSVQAFGGAR